MPRVRYIEHGGREHEVEAEAGKSLMQVAVASGVRGILGDCGGCASCGTCHVYVDEAWAGRLPAPDDLEQAMIEMAIDPLPTSRLSCQIVVGPGHEGLTVRLPRSQI
jgi:2Fe-2S ferredoxin